MTLSTAGIGALAGSSPAGATLCGGILVAAAVAFYPAVGVLLAIGLRPIFDCLWFISAVNIGSIRVDLKSVYSLLVSGGVVIALASGGWRPRYRMLWGAIALYGAVSFWGVLVSPAKGVAISYFGRAVLPFVFLAMGEHMGRTGKSPLLIASVMATYAAIPVLTGGLQLAGVILPLEGAVSHAWELTRITGLYHHPIDIALRCSVALPFALLLHRRAPSAALRGGMLAWGVLTACIGYTTHVRSALVAISMQVVCWLWLTGARRVLLLVVPSLLALATFSGDTRAVIDRAWQPLAAGNYYELGSGRGLLFAAQVRAFTAGSLGQIVAGRGMHSTPQMSIEYNPVPELDLSGPGFSEGQIGAHNQVLRLLVESGLLGLIALLAVVVALARKCSTARQQCKGTDSEYFAAATITLFIAMAIYSISAVPLDAPSITWPLWLVAGYATSVKLGQSTLAGDSAEPS